MFDRLVRKITGSSKRSVAEQISQFWQLKKDGALTQEEFDEQKALLLGSNRRTESEDAKMRDPCHPVGEQNQPRTSERKPATKREVSTVPTMNDFMRPMLQWASRRSGKFALREATDAMSDYFNLSEGARNELTDRGSVEKVYDRTNWSVWHLKCADLLLQISKGYYEITDAGKKEAFSSDEVITKDYLANNFHAYQDAQKEKTPKYTQEKFDSELLMILREARSEGKKFCRVVSRDLHRRVVGGWKSNRVRMACRAMEKLWDKQGRHQDRIIHTTPSGQSSTIEIEFSTDV